jgi:hypothetical protein
VSFHMTAAGTRNQVVDSLDGLRDDQIGYDNFGVQLRDLLVDVIGQGSDLEPPSDQRYEVTVSGHSGRSAPVTLTAEVKLVQVPPVAPPAEDVVAEPVQEVRLAEEGSATEALNTNP